MLTDYEIERLPKEPLEALRTVCKSFLETDASLKDSEHLGNYEDYLRCFALVDSIVEQYDLSFNAKRPEIQNSVVADCANIASYIRQLYKEIKEQSARLTYDAQRAAIAIKLGRGHLYEFTDGDLQRIQSLISELRNLTSSTSDLNDDHKRRFLSKLERLQSELHKRVSDLDRFYGLVGEAGVVLGKLGKDAKPFVDRIREIAQIVWRTQSKREELPSSAPPPMLPPPNADSENDV